MGSSLGRELVPTTAIFLASSIGRPPYSETALEKRGALPRAAEFPEWMHHRDGRTRRAIQSIAVFSVPFVSLWCNCCGLVCISYDKHVGLYGRIVRLRPDRRSRSKAGIDRRRLPLAHCDSEIVRAKFGFV